MTDETYPRLAFAACAALAIGGGVVAGGLAGCGADSGGDDPPDPARFALHESRSSTIALAEDGSRVAMVNPEDGSLSVFQTSDHARTAKIATGTTPASVALTADGTAAYVANRGDGTVVRVAGIDGGTPRIDATIEVGAEPVAVALSPSGTRLFVAELAESRVAVIDTATLQVVASVAVDRPRALLVTNNGDASEDDERLIVTELYGAPVPGKEAKDDGRTGTVHVLALADLAQRKTITLAPIASGFPRGGVAGNPSVTTAPNQLAAVATAQGRLYVTSVSASPEGPPRFDNNVFPVVYVADLAAGAEVTGAGGTTNLARAIYDAHPSPSPASPRFVPGDLTDIDFVRGSNVGYVVGRAGDVMVRVTFGERVEVGSTQNAHIDLAGSAALGTCQNPSGLVVDGERQRAYVNCWISRRLGVVDLGAQALVQTVEAAPPPATAIEASVQRGKRFYFTGRGRWSAPVGNGAKGGEGWSSCGSCHPDGHERHGRPAVGASRAARQPGRVGQRPAGERDGLDDRAARPALKARARDARSAQTHERPAVAGRSSSPRGAQNQLMPTPMLPALIWLSMPSYEPIRMRPWRSTEKLRDDSSSKPMPPSSAMPLSMCVLSA